MSKERLRNEDARGGDVIVNDSIASGQPETDLGSDEVVDTDLGTDEAGNIEDERYEQKEELRGHGRKVDPGPPGSRSED
jgi:hypothetical protein